MNKRLDLLVGFFSYSTIAVFFPYFAIWLLKDHLLSPHYVGLTVSLGVLATRVTSAFCYKLIHHHQKKYVIILSMNAMVFAYLSMDYLAQHHISNPILWPILSIIIGGAMSLSAVALQAIVAQLAHSHALKKYSYLNLMINLSAGMSRLLGGMVLHHYDKFFSLVPVIFAVITVFLSLGLPNDLPAVPEKEQESSFSLKGLLTKPLQAFLLLNFFTFFVYSQYYYVFPLYVKPYLNPQIIGFLFFISCFLIGILQVPAIKLTYKLGFKTTILVANLCNALGGLFLIWAGAGIIALCFMGVMFYAFAETLYVPVYQVLVIELSAGKNIVFTSALLRLSWGVAETLATYLGIYFVAKGVGDVSFILGIIAALAACAMVIFMPHSRERDTAS